MISRTQTPSRAAIDIKQRGAAGDGLHDDFPVFQQALDSGTSPLFIPAGTYRIQGCLRLPSRCHIQADANARIVFGPGAGKNQHSFLISNADLEDGNEDIEIGGGIWDGNNLHQTRGTDAKPGGYTGVLAHFAHCRNLHLHDMTLVNPHSYHIRMGWTEDFRVERIRFASTVHTSNQDGVHLGGFCRRGIIRDLLATGPGNTNDDMVALNADDAISRTEVNGTAGPSKTSSSKTSGPMIAIRLCAS